MLMAKVAHGSQKSAGEDAALPAGGLGKLYGRRQGHQLRQNQKTLLAERLPKLRIDPPDEDRSIDPRNLFPHLDPEEIWLEIGYGGGEHLAAQAAAHPEIGMIGCEFFINGIAKMVGHIADNNLDNIRLHTGDAKELLVKIADSSLDRVFILFPDPWHKARHAKRRMISDWTLAELARCLKPGAELRVTTDIMDFCRWTLRHLRSHPEFEWTAESPKDWRIRDDDWPPTRYEAKAIRQGRSPVYLKFTRI